MKSREEYEASIYKKRDALLAKRKKNIRMAVSALSVVVCLGAAAFAVPELADKSDETQVPSATNASSGNGITENKSEENKAVFDEIGTYLADFSVTKTQSNHTAVFNGNTAEEAVQSAEGIEYLTMSEIYRIPETEIVADNAGTTAKASSSGYEDKFTGGEGFGFKPSGGSLGAESIEPDSSESYSTEEITSAAKKHLSEGDADKIIADKTNAVVSRKSDGTTTYTVYFYTAEKKITVKLSSGLDLIEITQKDISGGGTTQIAPAYNPNEE